MSGYTPLLMIYHTSELNISLPCKHTTSLYTVNNCLIHVIIQHYHSEKLNPRIRMKQAGCLPHGCPLSKITCFRWLQCDTHSMYCNSYDTIITVKLACWLLMTWCLVGPRTSAEIIMMQAGHCTSLTHWGRDKMAAIFQTTIWNAFSWMKMYEFRLRFHWRLFPGVQLTISQHWFR